MSPFVPRPTRAWPVYVALGLLLIFAVVLVMELIGTSGASNNQTAGLTADSYMDRVNTVLKGADPEDGDALIGKLECAACHREGAVNHIAPSFVGVAERAVTRRLPLTAAAYIYESITQPTAFVVEGYAAVMPQNYSQRLSDHELGSIIAYLLTPDAK